MNTFREDQSTGVNEEGIGGYYEKLESLIL